MANTLHVIDCILGTPIRKAPVFRISNTDSLGGEEEEEDSGISSQPVPEHDQTASHVDTPPLMSVSADGSISIPVPSTPMSAGLPQSNPRSKGSLSSMLSSGGSGLHHQSLERGLADGNARPPTQSLFPDSSDPLAMKAGIGIPGMGGPPPPPHSQILSQTTPPQLLPHLLPGQPMPSQSIPAPSRPPRALMGQGGMISMPPGSTPGLAQQGAAGEAAADTPSVPASGGGAAGMGLPGRPIVKGKNRNNVET